MVDSNPCLIKSPSGAVKYATRIGDAHDPCSTPIWTSFSSSRLPSKHMAALRPCRKDFTHLTTSIGMWNFRSVSSKYECGIVSKKPVISNVSIVTALSWFHAASISCDIAIMASWADLPLIPPYWVDGNNLYLAAKYQSLQACILSRVLPRTSRSRMSLYDLGFE